MTFQGPGGPGPAGCGGSNLPDWYRECELKTSPSVLICSQVWECSYRGWRSRLRERQGSFPYLLNAPCSFQGLCYCLFSLIDTVNDLDLLAFTDSPVPSDLCASWGHLEETGWVVRSETLSRLLGSLLCLGKSRHWSLACCFPRIPCQPRPSHLSSWPSSLLAGGPWRMGIWSDSSLCPQGPVQSLAQKRHWG